jgi:hypothetical protein
LEYVTESRDFLIEVVQILEKSVIQKKIMHLLLCFAEEKHRSDVQGEWLDVSKEK